jgi:heavy metal sensor kinase
LFANTRADAFYFVIWSRGGSLLIRSTNGPDEVPLPQRLGRDTRIHRRTRDPFRESYQFTELGDCVLVGRSLSAHWRSQRRLAWTIVATGGAALALGFGGGWWLTTRAIRPVEVISAAASRISAGNLSERIATAEPDNEIGRLAEVLNRTFARLEAAFTRQKQFTADAAHELRTPLAVLISEAQTALARERGAAEYRESLETTLETAQRMRRLTESLLELARFDAGHESLHREKFDLAQTTRERVELLRPIAAQRDIQIHCELAPTVCEGDSERLAQVITNILANAIHYNRDGGEIRILTASEGDASVLAVSDTGVGIASEELPHVFERFYRADKSRSRAEGSSGLGLAISKAIVEAHGGDISVHSELGTGTTFTVRLPSKRIR